MPERETPADEEFLPAKHKNDDGRWMWSKDKFLTDNADLEIVGDKVCIKHYLKKWEDLSRYRAYKGCLEQFPNRNGQ